MSTDHTSGYDVAVVVRDSEMTRVVRTLFLERFAPEGLLAEFAFPVPVGDGRTAAFFARIDLPVVNFLPIREFVDTLELALPERPINAMEVRLPFRESALTLDEANGGPDGAFNLRGDLSLILPLGYPEDDDGNAPFGVVRNDMLVWLRLAMDDPDPSDGGRRTRDKVDAFKTRTTGSGWSPIVHVAAEGGMADALRESELAAQLGGLGLGLSAGACPVDPSDVAPDTTPSVEVPSAIRCLDFETLTRNADPHTYLALKLKLSETALNEGVNIGANEVGRDWITDATRAGLLVANRFLINELLPPALIRGFLEQALARARPAIEDAVADDPDVPFGDRDDEIARRLDEEERTLAEQHFTLPLAIVVPVPIHIPGLPLGPPPPEEEDEDEPPAPPPEPNAEINSVAIALVADPRNAERQMVRITVGVSGGVEPFYTFDATLRVNARFETSVGRPALDVEIDENRQVDVRAAQGVVLPAQIVALILVVLNPLIGGLLVLGGLIAAFLADLLVDFVAWLALPGAVEGQLEVPGGAEPPVPLPFLFRQAEHDDLVFRGELPVHAQESATMQYLGFTPPGGTVFRLNLDRDRLELPRLGGVDDPLFRDAFTGVTAQTADVVLQGEELRPVNGAALHDFGTLPLWRALNLGQADLRAAGYRQASIFEISSQPFGDSNLTLTALIDPLDLQGSPQQARVRVIGARTDLGRFALVLVWHVAPSRLRCFYRRYNQALPGVELVARQQTTCAEAREITHAAEVPVSFEDLLFPSPEGIDESPATVTVHVGHRELSCQTTGTLEATPIQLRRPLDFRWAVIVGETRRDLVPGEETVVDLTLRPAVAPARPTLGRPNLARLLVTGPEHRQCIFETTRGRSATFTVEVTVVEAGTNTFVARRRISVEGTRFESVGFDVLGRLVDRLHRGARDPATPGGRGGLPGLGPPPGEGPDPQPEPDPGGERPGSGREARPQRSTRRRAVRAAPRQPATGGLDTLPPEAARDELLLRAVREIRALPEDALTRPEIRRYIGRIFELILAVRVPVIREEAGERTGEPPPASPPAR